MSSDLPSDNPLQREPTGISRMNLAVSATPFSSSISIPGQIQDFTPGEVSVLLEQSVPVGHSLAVKFRNATFNGEVLYCREKPDGYHTNIRIMDSAESGLRSTPRFSVKLPAHVFAQSASEVLAATITDISGTGLGCELPRALSVGETVAVESEMNIALGVVRHSRKLSERVFRAGILLHHVIEKHDQPGRFARITSTLKNVFPQG